MGENGDFQHYGFVHQQESYYDVLYWCSYNKKCGTLDKQTDDYTRVTAYSRHTKHVNALYTYTHGSTSLGPDAVVFQGLQDTARHNETL
jgi:hypothetical protein